MEDEFTKCYMYSLLVLMRTQFSHDTLYSTDLTRDPPPQCTRKWATVSMSVSSSSAFWSPRSPRTNMTMGLSR